MGFRSATSAIGRVTLVPAGDTGSGSVAVDRPAGLASGDWLIALVTSGNANSVITGPSGAWTNYGHAIYRFNASETYGFVNVWALRAGGSEPSSYTFEVTQTFANENETLGDLYVTLVAYSGIVGFDGTPKMAVQSADPPSTATLTPTKSQDLAVYGWATWDDTSALTPPADTTSRYKHLAASPSNDGGVLVADKQLSSTSTVPAEIDFVQAPLASGWVGIYSLLLVTSTPPAAPSLLVPGSGASIDTADGLALTGVYNSTDGTTMVAYACRLKISGAGAYSYWNAATQALQSTIVWNPTSALPGTDFNAPLPATAFDDDNTVYNWSLASQTSLGQQGAFASDSTFTAIVGATVAVDAPSGTVTTPTPTIAWTTTAGAGAVQTFYRVAVYSQAQYSASGFTPGAGTPVWDSTKLAGTNASAVSGPLPNNTTYRAYVQVTESGDLDSTWQYSGFTVTYAGPATPTLSVAAGTQASPADVPYPGGGTYPAGVSDYPALELTISGHDNLLPADDASFESGIGTWVSVSNATLSQSDAWFVDSAFSLSLQATAAGAVEAAATAVDVVAGSTYTGWAVLRAAVTARTVTLVLAWLDSDGTQLSTDTFDGTDSATEDLVLLGQAVAPVDAVTVQVGLQIAAAAAGEVHYGDDLGVFPGDVDVWSRGGLAGSGLGYVTYDIDGTAVMVRESIGGVPLTGPDQTVTIGDAEVVPGMEREYTAWVEVSV